MTAGSPGLSSNIDPTPAEVRAEARAIRAAEIAAAKEIRSVTLKTLFAFLFVTLLLTMVSTWRAAATTFVLAIACTTVGFIVGLLFSIPRAVAVGADLIAAAQQRQQEQLGQPGQQTPANSSLGLSRNLLSVNTNLEQVSDWLTKIFVGVGLVEFNNIKSAVIHGANLIGKALRESGTPIDTGTLIGVGIIVVYPGLGFLVGFFSVRLYISRAMWASDAEVARAYDPYNDELRTTMDLTTPRTSTSGPPGETAKPAEAPPEVRREALGVPLSALTKTEDILTRGRAAQQEGLTEDARAAFKRAIALDPSNMEAVLTYVYFLYSEKPVDYAEMITRLEDARRQFSLKISDDVRQSIMHELVNAYLYIYEPFGFQAAINVGNGYVVGLGAKDADAYVYLAAAHGQGYTYFKTRDPSVAKSELMLVIDSVRKALALGEAQTKDWLRYLATEGSEDEDLVDAATDSAELRELLNLVSM